MLNVEKTSAPPARLSNGAAAGLGLVGALVGVAGAVLILGGRGFVTVAVPTTDSRFVLPLGWWTLTAIYAAIVGRLVMESPLRVAARAVCIAAVFHCLLALAPVLAAPRDSLASAAYWYYTRLYCVVALSAALAWAVVFCAEVAAGRRSGLDLADTPILAATIIVALSAARHGPELLLFAVVVGAVTAVAFLNNRVRRIAAAWGTSGWLEKGIALGIFLAALAFRLWFTRRVMTNADYIDTGSDGSTYDRVAWSIAQGRGIPADFSAAYPLILLGYVRFVALIYAVAGHSYFAVCAVQSALGAATCVFSAVIARRAAGRAAALMAGVLSAVSFQLIFSAAAIGHQGLDVFVLATIVLVLGTFSDRGSFSIAGATGIGLLLGIATAIRETNALVWVFAELWLFVIVLRVVGWQAAVRRSLAVAVGFVLVVSPLLFARLATAEERASVRKHLDLLWCLSCGELRSTIGSPFESGGTAPTAAPAPATAQSHSMLSAAARAAGHNLAVQFVTEPYGAFDLVFLQREWSFHDALWLYTYLFAAIGLALMIARARAVKDARPVITLILGVIAARTAPHLLLESAYRHRAPIEPYLLIVIATGVVLLAQSGTARPAAARAH